MELVTGRAGTPHITSQQHRQMHQGIWGEEAYILNTGNMLEPEVQSSNKILIKDGALMFQGALFSVKVGTTDEITINNGNQGMKRKDLVVVRYTYDQSQNIESAEWKVIQGTPAESNPVAPSGTSGDIQVGDSVVDCPFMIVNLDGINVTGVDIIPEKIQTIPELIGDLETVSNKIQAGHTDNIDVDIKTYKDVNITFQKNFKNPPAVLACIRTFSNGSAYGNISCACNEITENGFTRNEITENGFTLRIYNDNDTGRNPSFWWVAIG